MVWELQGALRIRSAQEQGLLTETLLGSPQPTHNQGSIITRDEALGERRGEVCLLHPILLPTSSTGVILHLRASREKSVTEERGKECPSLQGV